MANYENYDITLEQVKEKGCYKFWVNTKYTFEQMKQNVKDATNEDVYAVMELPYIDIEWTNREDRFDDDEYGINDYCVY
jgi:hypothetical protein